MIFTINTCRIVVQNFRYRFLIVRAHFTHCLFDCIFSTKFFINRPLAVKVDLIQSNSYKFDTEITEVNRVERALLKFVIYLYLSIIECRVFSTIYNEYTFQLIFFFLYFYNIILGRSPRYNVTIE